VARIIRNPKDFWIGVIYIVFGAIAFWITRDYRMGSASQMGPGYFPTVLSSLLIIFGVISVVRSFLRPGEPIGAFGWKGAILVFVGTVLFGYLESRAGMIIALIILVFTSGAASKKFRFGWKTALWVIVLTGFCVLVFVKGLGLPFRLLGSWFGD
jgi:hypothetical protein